MKLLKNYKIMTWVKCTDNPRKWEMDISDIISHCSFQKLSICIYKKETRDNFLVYAHNFWIINEGHDFSIHGNKLITNSPEVASSYLLIQWGRELKMRCPNKHVLPTGSILSFCPDCGIKLG